MTLRIFIFLALAVGLQSYAQHLEDAPKSKQPTGPTFKSQLFAKGELIYFECFEDFFKKRVRLSDGRQRKGDGVESI